MSSIQDLEYLLKTSQEAAREKQIKYIEQLLLDLQYERIMQDDDK